MTACGVLVGFPVVAVEYQVSREPREVRVDLLAERQVVVIDWGVAGSAVARRPQRVQEELDGLRALATAPEIVGSILQVTKDLQGQTTDMVKTRMAAAVREYNTVGRETMVPASVIGTERRAPIPDYFWGWPTSARSSMRVVIFDDRSEQQRAMVLALGRRSERDRKIMHAFALGWKTGADRDGYWSTRHGVTPVADDRFAAWYGVERLPAIIEFEGDLVTWRVREGMRPIPDSEEQWATE
jgi:hypothetical protein